MYIIFSVCCQQLFIRQDSFIRLAVEDGEPLLYCKKEGAASQQLYAV